MSNLAVRRRIPRALHVQILMLNAFVGVENMATFRSGNAVLKCSTLPKRFPTDMCYYMIKLMSDLHMKLFEM